MSDSFAIEATLEPVTPESVWQTLDAVSRVVSKLDHAVQHPWHRPHAWSIRGDGRTWERPTLAEVRRVAQLPDEDSYVAWWSYYGAELQWSLRAHRFQSTLETPDLEMFPEIVVTLQCYAGRDRMRTEEVFRGVSSRLGKRGLAVRASATRVSSTDDGKRDADKRRAPRVRAPFSDRVRASVAEHTGRYAVGVLTGVTVAGVVAFLGLSR